VSDDSQTVISCLRNEAKKFSVRVLTQHKVVALSSVKTLESDIDSDSDSDSDSDDDSDKHRWELHCSSDAQESITTIAADCVIVATGSSRQGYDLLRSVGHSIVAPVPSLFSFAVKDDALKQLAGTSVTNAKVKLLLSKDFIKSDEGQALGLHRAKFVKALETEGPLLVTHQGLSGPGVLRLSSFGARVLAALQYSFRVEVNWVHGLDVDREEMLSLLLEDKHTQSRQNVFSTFPSRLSTSEKKSKVATTTTTTTTETAPYLSKRLWAFFLHRAGVQDRQTKWGDLSKAQTMRLADELCRGEYSVSGRGQFKEEFVTAGGVNLDEVDFNTFGSKKASGLFICGEALNVDGVTGGYNFQNAWTSGHTAGAAAARYML
jgi:predicted flavoprotein YhiN